MNNKKKKKSAWVVTRWEALRAIYPSKTFAALAPSKRTCMFLYARKLRTGLRRHVTVLSSMIGLSGIRIDPLQPVE
jgi:hypothetical protein